MRIEMKAQYQSVNNYCSVCRSEIPEDTQQKYLNVYCTNCEQWTKIDSGGLWINKCKNCGTRFEFCMEHGVPSYLIPHCSNCKGVYISAWCTKCKQWTSIDEGDEGDEWIYKCENCGGRFRLSWEEWDCGYFKKSDENSAKLLAKL